MSACAPALAQDIDAIQVDPAHHRVLFENNQVRVVRWTVAIRDKTLHHSHPDSVNVNLTDYNGRVIKQEGTSEVHDKAGSVMWRPAVIHMVENIGNEAMEGLIVEPKVPASARPAGSDDPVVLDPIREKVEFENELIRVVRSRREPGSSFPMHGHPDSVQIFLTDVDGTITTVDGKVHKVTGKAGEVHWRPATQHSDRVQGNQPVEQILIEMKGAGH